MSDSAFLAAMVDVEIIGWQRFRVRGGTAAAARTDLAAVVSAAESRRSPRAQRPTATPVLGLVALLRDRTGGETGRWLHRGLTSQDVVDTALMLCLRDGISAVRGELAAQVRALATLVEANQHSPMLARTLTQAACRAPSERGWPTGSRVCSTPPISLSPWLPCPCRPVVRPEHSPPQPN